MNNFDFESLDELETLDDEIHAETELSQEYKPVNQLHVPEEARRYYAELGFDLQWVRIYVPSSHGKIDLKNIQMKEGDLYEFVKRSEVPGLKKAMTGYFSDQVTQNINDLYVVGELALAKFPKVRQKAKRMFFQERTRSRSQALISDLRKNSLMPKEGSTDEFRTTRHQPKSRSVDFGE